MTDSVDHFLAQWFEDTDARPNSESDFTSNDASNSVAESLLVHGMLTDLGNRNDDLDAKRIQAVMQQIDAESVKAVQTDAPRRRRRFAILTTLLAVAAAVMLMFVVSGPHQNVSAAMASLEKVMEAAARPIDRTYHVRVVEEYPRDKRPRNLAEAPPSRSERKQIDGATLFVRGANQYVMTVTLASGQQRTSGCDGQQSWAFRGEGPIHVSSDLNRFRGGLPGQQQDIPFLNIHDHLSQLLTGYDIQLVQEPLKMEHASTLSLLLGVRKSKAVRGPKQVEISFDFENGTVHRMLLDGLPRGGGGPKSVMLELIDQSPLDADFFSHVSHHEPNRRIRLEESHR